MLIHIIIVILSKLLLYSCNIVIFFLSKYNFILRNIMTCSLELHLYSVSFSQNVTLFYLYLFYFFKNATNISSYLRLNCL